MGGFGSFVSGLKKATKATVGAIVNTTAEIAHRTTGAADYVASAAGLLAPKMMRVQIHILRDANSNPVLDLASAQRLFEETRRIFKQRAKIDIRGASPYVPAVRVLDGKAPEYALDINRSIARQYFGEIDAYFDRNSNVTHSSVIGKVMDTAGYGEPIHVFIVNSLAGAEGRSYGFPKDHVIVDRTARRTTIAHEIGHQCGLLHDGDGNNLMHPTNDADELNRWQVASIRNSRYATFFNDGR